MQMVFKADPYLCVSTPESIWILSIEDYAQQVLPFGTVIMAGEVTMVMVRVFFVYFFFQKVPLECNLSSLCFLSLGGADALYSCIIVDCIYDLMTLL